MLNSHGRVESLATIRYPGVLQRIGVTYLIVGILEASLANRVANTSEVKFILFRKIRINKFRL